MLKEASILSEKSILEFLYEKTPLKNVSNHARSHFFDTFVFKKAHAKCRKAVFTFQNYSKVFSNDPEGFQF